MGLRERNLLILLWNLRIRHVNLLISTFNLRNPPNNLSNSPIIPSLRKIWNKPTTPQHLKTCENHPAGQIDRFDETAR
ncbi:hypothetical protein BHE18_01760 [Rossellomorea aquimaris]|uniref:Uncharacterized protein n=1 Tax=Rossellomorea aquimaris TaxID=189382 RepID=A0A1J6VV62_9BACI|nr:hypothetical protein BHE18_01760 [Rossellomorea aquimaris]